MNMIKKTFEQTGIGKLRTVIIEGEPWFLGIDVGACLGYTNPRIAYHVHTEEKYRKALFYKDCNDSELSELWLSMYEVLENELDEAIRKTKPTPKEKNISPTPVVGRIIFAYIRMKIHSLILFRLGLQILIHKHIRNIEQLLHL